MPELFYMVADRVNYKGAIKAFNLLQSSAFQIEGLTANDVARMEEVMTQYGDNEFDFVDVSIMVLAERLNIVDIYMK